MQRDIGFNLIADAAYVGNAGRNQLLTVDINGRPYGYAYQPSSLDPTNVVGRTGAAAAGRLSAALPGLRTHPAAEFSGYADYHSLQFSVNRRRSADGLSVGAAYTYQISNKTLGAIDPFVEDNHAPGTTRRTGGGRTSSCSTTRTRCRT